MSTQSKGQHDPLTVMDFLNDPLEPGDILIKYAEEPSSRVEKLVVGVQSGVKEEFKVMGDPKSMHVAMYVGDGHVVEESAGGLKQQYPDPSAKEYFVWRFANKKTCQRAAQIMRVWSGAEKDTEKALFGLPKRKKLLLKSVYGGLLSSPAFLPQIFGMSFPGLKTILGRLKHKVGWQGTMICSEAVIAAYQLAADENAFVLALNSPIKLDPHRTSPMKLEEWLLENFLSKNSSWELKFHLKKNGEWKSIPLTDELRRRLERMV